jgi:hypothetical protein
LWYNNNVIKTKEIFEMKNKLEDLFDTYSTGTAIFIVVIAFLLIGALAFGILCFEGWILMLLWNAILVPLFHFGALKFWWAVGIILICNILFKSASSASKGE